MIDQQDVMDGLVLGDGRVLVRLPSEPCLVIGKKDQDYFSSDVKGLIIEKAPYGTSSYRVKTSITTTECCSPFGNRSIPARFLNADSFKARGFLRGLFSANGSVCAGHDDWIALRQTSLGMIKDAASMLLRLGIRSSYISQPTWKWGGTWTHTLHVASGRAKSRDRQAFIDQIGFIQKYRQAALENMVKAHAIPA